jgi:hypothetical protein
MPGICLAYDIGGSYVRHMPNICQVYVWHMTLTHMPGILVCQAYTWHMTIILGPIPANPSMCSRRHRWRSLWCQTLDDAHQFVRLVTCTQTDIVDFPPSISFKIVMCPLEGGGGSKGIFSIFLIFRKEHRFNKHLSIAKRCLFAKLSSLSKTHHFVKSLRDLRYCPNLGGAKPGGPAGRGGGAARPGFVFPVAQWLKRPQCVARLPCRQRQTYTMYLQITTNHRANLNYSQLASKTGMNS